MVQVPAVQVNVRDNLGSSLDIAACLSEVAREGAELKAETGGARVELCRAAKDRWDRGDEERMRGTRWNRKMRRLRRGSMADLKRGFF